MNRSAGLLACLLACGPTAAELRLRSVHHARIAAVERPGPRQLQELAEAIHVAYRAGDYRQQPTLLTGQVDETIRLIDRTTEQRTLDTPTLIAWKGLLQIDVGQAKPGFESLQRSFAMAPNAMAGRNLIVIYGTANRPEDVARVCLATTQAIDDADERMNLIALCRQHMNAASLEGEIAWMDRGIAIWYRDELTRREHAEQVAEQQRATRARQERQVVRRVEQCAASCKETGLRCQNRCEGDANCEQRCVGINHACLDRCESAAYEELDVDPRR